MPSIQKKTDGWVVLGDTVEDLLIGAQAIERLEAEKAVEKPTEPVVHPVIQKAMEAGVRVMRRAVVEGGRMAQIRQFISENGPMHRKEVIERSGIPVGTINTILSEKNFQQLPDGRWTADSPASERSTAQ